jgi:VanZ family protein
MQVAIFATNVLLWSGIFRIGGLMYLKNISWLPAVIVMIMIYCFSSKPAVESNESSLTIANGLLTVYEDATGGKVNEMDRRKVLESINFVVRKGAHFSEYGVLACAFMFHFLLLKRREKRYILWSVAFAALYAVTDEVHQLFIPGRSGQARDVLIDSAGALTGALLFYFFIAISKWEGKMHGLGEDRNGHI